VSGRRVDGEGRRREDPECLSERAARPAGGGLIQYLRLHLVGPPERHLRPPEVSPVSGHDSAAIPLLDILLA